MLELNLSLSRSTLTRCYDCQSIHQTYLTANRVLTSSTGPIYKFPFPNSHGTTADHSWYISVPQYNSEKLMWICEKFYMQSRCSTTEFMAPFCKEACTRLCASYFNCQNILLQTLTAILRQNNFKGKLDWEWWESVESEFTIRVYIITAGQLRQGSFLFLNYYTL